MIEEVVQKSKTHDGITITGLNELLEFNVGRRRIRLTSASAAPTAANDAIHVRIGFTFTQSEGDAGSVDFVSGIARRYRPLVLNYPRIVEGPGTLYAAALSEVTAVVNPYTFNVVYEVLQ